jgi:hypothetical protein
MASTLSGLCRILRETAVKSSRVPAVFAHSLSQTETVKSDSVPVEKFANQNDSSVSTPQGEQAPAKIDKFYRANAGKDVLFVREITTMALYVLDEYAKIYIISTFSDNYKPSSSKEIRISVITYHV